jgi:hypothetical protein
VSVSAQETTPGQAASSLALMASTTSYPRTPRFSGASFSAVLPGVESSRMEPSQPSTKQSREKRRSTAPARWRFSATMAVISLNMTSSACGHVSLYAPITTTWASAAGIAIAQIRRRSTAAAAAAAGLSGAAAAIALALAAAIDLEFFTGGELQLGIG